MIKFIGKVYKGNMLRKYKKIPSSIQNIVTIYLNENKFTCFWETLEKRSPKLATGTQIAVHGSITHKVKRRPKLWNFYNARCCQTCYNDNFTVHCTTHLSSVLQNSKTNIWVNLSSVQCFK